MPTQPSFHNWRSPVGEVGRIRPILGRFFVCVSELVGPFARTFVPSLGDVLEAFKIHSFETYSAAVVAPVLAMLLALVLAIVLAIVPARVLALILVLVALALALAEVLVLVLVVVLVALNLFAQSAWTGIPADGDSATTSVHKNEAVAIRNCIIHVLILLNYPRYLHYTYLFARYPMH